MWVGIEMIGVWRHRNDLVKVSGVAVGQLGPLMSQHTHSSRMILL